MRWAPGVSMSTEFVPESEDDRRFLEPLNHPHFEGERGSVTITMDLRSGPVCAENVGFLWDRAVAVRLYGDASRAHSPTSAVRDLWRVLESAFGRKTTNSSGSFRSTRTHNGWDSTRKNSEHSSSFAVERAMRSRA